MGAVQVTMAGNVVSEPELKFTPGGSGVVRFRVACTDRRFNRQTNNWEDGDTVFLDVEAWRSLAENIAETLRKGTAVMVHGKLSQRTYENREGQKVTVYEVVQAEVGVDLARQSAVVTRNTANGAQGQPAAAPAAPAAPAQPAPPSPPSPQPVLDEPPF